jgi:hypothetical protein
MHPVRDFHHCLIWGSFRYARGYWGLYSSIVSMFQQVYMGVASAGTGPAGVSILYGFSRVIVSWPFLLLLLLSNTLLIQ